MPHTDEFIVGKIIRQGANTEYTDYAVFEIDTKLRDYDKENSIHKLDGRVTKTEEPYDGMKVQKVGQYTGHSYGIVYNVNEKNGTFGIKPNPDKRVKQISEGGDSGSLWVTDESDFKAVGLHISGERRRRFFRKRRRPRADRATAIMIDKVLSDLKIRF